MSEWSRAWAHLLLAGVYLAGLALGALFFVALERVCGARWSRTWRGVPVAFASLLPIAAVLVMLALLARPILAPWTTVSSDTHGWMSPTWLVLRTAVYFGLWGAFLRTLVRNHDRALGAPTHARWAGAFLVVFAPTVWLAAGDWLMSLLPDWTSTIYGVYVFAGFVASALAAMLLVAVWRQRRPTGGPAPSTDQVRDLALLLFGFSSLWMYLWYCQYLLIWYTNLPHETPYFAARLRGGSAAAFYAIVVLKWALPFVLLLSRAGKRNAGALVPAALSALAGQWLDLYVAIVPSAAPVGPVLGALDVAALAALATALVGYLSSRMPAARPIAAPTEAQ